MKRNRKIICALVVYVLLCMSILSFQSFGNEGTDRPETDNKCVIFLLDASGSMKSNDPNRLAIDSIAQLIYTLPTSYRVGFVAYNTGVIAAQPPLDSSQREQIMALAGAVKYVDYSNAGEGLSQAVGLLQLENAKEKTIVMLSDGEILLNNDSASAQSLAAYQAAANQAAQSGIKIHVIGLGKDMANTENSIFAAASGSGGGIYFTPQAMGIQNAIDSILMDQLGIKQTTAAIVDAAGGMESLSIDLPFAHASKVRVLLTSAAPIQNLNTDFQADSARQIRGERYSLIEMIKPGGDHIDLTFMGVAGNQIRITLIPEYQVEPKLEITYKDRVPDDKEAVSYAREATVTYTFYDSENENIQLWTESYFNHGKLPLWIDGNANHTALKEGAIVVTGPVTENKTEQIVFDYTKLPVNVLGTDTIEAVLKGPPALPVKEPEPPYLLIGAVLVIVIGSGAVFWFARRPKPIPLPPDDKPEPGKYSYVGKLNLYITRTQSGYDVPPLSYDLFRLPSTQVVSLREILESCDVEETFAGLERIYIKSGAGRTLILTNNSDCTIMKNREILMKKKSYELSVESKVDITCEDEVSELTVQYKDLKPSEMR